ncbi:MAG: glycosyltransferase, partial [Bacteroidota bacterium]
MVATKLAMNILYICTPNSIHDQKWMRYFAEKEEFNVYSVGESKIDESTFNDLKKQNINLLPSLDSFSIKTPYKNYRSIQKLREYCELFNIDLVHVLFASPYALWATYINKPYMITTRGSDVLVVLPELKKQKGIKRLYFLWLFKKFQKAFSGALTITSTSELQKKRISEIFNLEAKVIRTGVEVEKIAAIKVEDYLPSELKGIKYIFSPRFMSPIYNISFQIEALAFLP